MPQGMSMYNVMNSFDDVAVTSEPAYFSGLFTGINIVCVGYALILVKRQQYQRAFALMTMLAVSNIAITVGLAIMYEYSNTMPGGGISFLFTCFTPVIVLEAMEAAIVFLSAMGVSPTIYSQVPGLLLAFYNAYGIPISAISLVEDEIDVYLMTALAATLIGSIAIAAFYIIGYRRTEQKELQPEEVISFSEMGRSLVIDSTNTWVIINMIFPIIGMTVNFPRIVSGLLDVPMDDSLVTDIAIDGYIKSTIASQLVVLILTFIPIGWTILTSETTQQKYSRTTWVIQNMMIWVYTISIIATIVCIGFGTKTSLIAQSYIDSSLPISFFSIAYSRYASRNTMTNTPIMFGLGLAIASASSFINVAIEDWYHDAVGIRCLIIIPCFISLVMVFYRMRTDMKTTPPDDVTVELEEIPVEVIDASTGQPIPKTKFTNVSIV